jgi:sporulation protein YlmC with PRC-barrel domain
VNPARGVSGSFGSPTSKQLKKMETPTMTTFATAQAVEFTNKVDGSASAISTYFRRTVYDPKDEKIGEVTDLLVGSEGKISTAIISVGGFLGIGDKEVAVPFSSLHVKRKDNSWYLAMNTTKDALKGTPNFAYAGERARW